MKWRYKENSNFLISKGTIIEAEPSTIWNSILQKEIKVLYYQDEKGENFPILLSKFELI